MLLTERAVQALLRVRLGQDLDRRGWGDAYQPHDLVFARKNGAPLRPEYVTRRFVALTKAAGLRQVRLHDLRHGAASLMLAAGVPMAIGLKMLRRPSIGITVDTYDHLSEDTARTASGDRAATTGCRQCYHPGQRDRRTCWSARWAPWGSNPQPAD